MKPKTIYIHLVGMGIIALQRGHFNNKNSDQRKRYYSDYKVRLRAPKKQR